jgi:DNA-binding transcriptional ArsR family regulator
MNKNTQLKLFKALGEDTKNSILNALSKGEKCACEIPGIIGRKQANTSMHLGKMQDWGLIKSRRDGKRILYSLSMDISSLLKAAEKISGSLK